MKKTAPILNKRLNTLIKRNEPSSVQNDCKDALKSKKTVDKEVAITQYNKWLKS